MTTHASSVPPRGFDDLAGDSVAGEPGDGLFGWKAAADPRFHQLARPHSGGGGQQDHRVGADDSDQGDGLEAVQGRGQGSTGEESVAVSSAASRAKTSFTPTEACLW
ncbi:hypothetical protein [Kitasatospora sp. NPDC050543]|uniref:hypothetical protein n=1 Tax=Kitasatospora sp. NPDC050543 TaxID=3364054 RepID=UPI0037A55E44